MGYAAMKTWGGQWRWETEVEASPKDKAKVKMTRRWR
jgi:hypothetical protein